MVALGNRIVGSVSVVPLATRCAIQRRQRVAGEVIFRTDTRASIHFRNVERFQSTLVPEIRIANRQAPKSPVGHWAKP